MTIGPWLRPPRRLLLAFLATTCLLTAGLAWLGWQVVGLDRRLERQRTDEQLERAVDVVARALGTWLLDVDRDLATLVSRAGAADTVLPPRVTNLPADTSWVVVARSSVRVFPEASLAFYPEVHPNVGRVLLDPPDAAGPKGPALQQGERALVALSNAAAFRREGQHDRALAVYAGLAKSQVVVPGLDAPADIVALHARCLVFDSIGRTDALRREARGLADAVANPARRLSRRVYSYYAAEAQRWIGAGAPSTHQSTTTTGPIARATTVGTLVDRWRQRSTTAEPSTAPHVEYATDGPFIAASIATDQALAMLVAPATVIQALIDDALATTPGISLTITDGNGTAILGGLGQEVTNRVIRTPAETRLPWALAASPGPGWVPDAAASERQRLVMIGVLLLGAAVLGGAWITGRAMHRELEAARLQAEFVATVSHEFRTPLAAFGQLTELLVDGRVATDADRLEYYRRLQHETRRLERLVDDLLDFRRMEAGAREYEFTKVDLVSLTKSVVADCQPGGAAVQPRLDFSSSEPEIAVRADREAISRALRNLVENALKYAPGTPAIRVHVEANAKSASVAVTDTGPGIEPELQEAIFEKFVRAGAAGGAVRGTGLGLAMVRHIANAHGGTARVYSAVNQGSTFVVSLPLSRAAEPGPGGA